MDRLSSVPLHGRWAYRAGKAGPRMLGASRADGMSFLTYHTAVDMLQQFTGI
jgi:hypothetical protein